MIMKWKTLTGEIAMEIKPATDNTYRYNGKYGAGSGFTEAEMEIRIKEMQQYHPKVKPCIE